MRQAPMEHGSSGSPGFDRDGLWVGVVFGGRPRIDPRDVPQDPAAAADTADPFRSTVRADLLRRLIDAAR
jgi:hypothetical protein